MEEDKAAEGKVIMAWKSYKEESKANWGQNVEGNICWDQIQLGAILRIADALEAIAQNYQNLINERDQYRRWYEEERDCKSKAYRSQYALRGVITKLKKAS